MTNKSSDTFSDCDISECCMDEGTGFIESADLNIKPTKGSLLLFNKGVFTADRSAFKRSRSI